MQSPSTGRFQQALEQAVSGALSLSGLTEPLEIYREILEHTREEFEESLLFHPPEALEACDVHVRAVRRRLQSLDELCGDLSRALAETGPLDPGLLDRWRKATAELNDHLRAYRESALRGAGPTALAGVNLIVAAHEQVASGAAPAEFLADSVAAERDRVGSVLGHPGLGTEVRGAFEDLERCLDILAQELPDAGEATLERLMERAQVAAAALQREDQRRSLSLGPTLSARFNLILNLAEAGRRADFFQEAEAVFEDLQKARRQVPSQGLDDPAPVERLLAALQSCEESLCGLYTSVEKDQPTGSRRAQLEQAVRSLEAGALELEEALERIDRKVCARCGKLYPATALVCDCGATLPGLAGVTGPRFELSRSSAPRAPEHLARLFELIQRLEEGRSGAGPLHQFVHELLDGVERVRQHRLDEQFLQSLALWEDGLRLLLEVNAPGQSAQLAMAADQLAEAAARIQDSSRSR
ncbi:MAG: hypothetical protein HY319_12015 [Armatimonadetes bacterium]|nr:hypothetical protein [Armatimonadota bacterium]